MITFVMLLAAAWLGYTLGEQFMECVLTYLDRS